MPDRVTVVFGARVKTRLEPVVPQVATAAAQVNTATGVAASVPAADVPAVNAAKPHDTSATAQVGDARGAVNVAAFPIRETLSVADALERTMLSARKLTPFATVAAAMFVTLKVTTEGTVIRA